MLRYSLIFALPLFLSFTGTGRQGTFITQPKAEPMQVIIHTPTNGIENSRDFYGKLSFKALSEKPLIYTDGKAVIEVNPDRNARAGLKLYKASWKEDLKTLEELTAVTKTPEGYVLSDGNGVWLYLAEREFKSDHKPADSSFSGLGNYMGVTLECLDIKKSAKIYEALGFSLAQGDLQKGFAVMTTAEGFGVTPLGPLMCPHLFFNPSLTYFNGKERNPKIIARLRELNIPITEEISVFNKEGLVDNVIIRDPGGYGFFIFND